MQIKAENLNYVYSPKTPFEKTALDNVSFTVNEGDTLGIVGATGSGKSTLTRHLNALIRIQSGKIFLGDVDLSAKRVDLKEVRKKVGMLFQFPEYQLFADTVKKDVEFGPKNFGFGDKEAACAAEDALRSVGLDINRSPKYWCWTNPPRDSIPWGKERYFPWSRNLKKASSKRL